MGTKYTSQTQSGYNASAPPDDGSTGATNLIAWARMRTKSGDPNLTLSQNINTALTAALDFSGRSTASNDLATSADHMRTIECTAVLTATLPTASSIGAGYIVNYKNSSSGIVTIALQTGTDTLDSVVNGSVVLQPGQSQTYKTNIAANGYIIISHYAAGAQGITTSRQATLSGPYDVLGIPNFLPQTATGLNLTSVNIGATDTIITANVTTPVASPGVVNWTGHTLIIGQAVSFTTSGALPTGLTAGTVYYVIATGFGANAFEVALTQGGAAINFTGSTSGQSVCWGGQKNPLVVTSMAGQSTIGQVNVVGQSSSNLTWTALTNTATNYLYVTIVNGVLTSGFTTLVPVIQNASITSPSATLGQITINIVEGEVYLGNGSTAVQTNLVVLGTATASGGNITATYLNPYNFSPAGAGSMVRLNTANGYGATNTMIRRFTNTVTNIGADITYADSATLGATFTINASGVYAINYMDNFTAASYVGISLNSTQLTTGIQSINIGDRLVVNDASAANINSNAATTVYLTAGSVIRAHTASGASGAGLPAIFTITRVS